MPPAFNNRHATFDLIEHEGRTCIRYRQRHDQAYPPHVLEAAAVLRDHPCPYIPAVHEVHEDHIIGEYLDGFFPIGKAGVTSSIYSGLYFRDKRRGRFRRRHLRNHLRSAHDHLPLFLEQIGHIGRYLQHHQLWHDDMIPQNFMWHAQRLELRLVDIAAFFPRRLLDDGTRLPFTHRRQRSPLRIDYSLDEACVRETFFLDLAPWWQVLARRAGAAERNF